MVVCFTTYWFWEVTQVLPRRNNPCIVQYSYEAISQCYNILKKSTNYIKNSENTKDSWDVFHVHNVHLYMNLKTCTVHTNLIKHIYVVTSIIFLWTLVWAGYQPEGKSKGWKAELICAWVRQHCAGVLYALGTQHPVQFWWVIRLQWWDKLMWSTPSYYTSGCPHLKF